jgi:hypothetical protein
MQPAADQAPEFHLQFGSALAWDNGRCWEIAVGAASPGYEMSRVYLYHLLTPLSRRWRENEYAQVVVIGTVFAAGMIIAIVIVMIVYLVLRYRRGRRNIRDSGDIRVV